MLQQISINLELQLMQELLVPDVLGIWCQMKVQNNEISVLFIYLIVGWLIIMI
jgi:hypothetical protein